MDIGNITLPAIERAKFADIKRSTDAVGGLGARGYEMAEYLADLPSVELTGYLLQLYGGSRTLQQFKEDAEALTQRKVGYNSVTSVKGRSGWISCSLVDVDDEAGELWPVSIQGQWLDESQYKVQYSSNPVTRANDWAITGSYDQSAVEAADDVQCFDGSLEIFSTHRVFSGNCTIKNGLYQVILSSNTISVYYWSGSAYTKIDDFTAGTFDTITLTELTQDIVKCKTNNYVEITMGRGRVPHINSPEDLTCGSLTPADQSTSTDNYLTLGTDLYVCSDRNFSIASDVIDAGNLCIFQEDTAPHTVAHDALVISNLKREVVSR